jgi:hypothetical protein
MLADAAYQATQMIADFSTRRWRARAQQQRDWPGCRGVINMDRQEAALIIVRIEQRHLLMPMHDIQCVVDVQRHRGVSAG